jgi:hypothetical protein
MNTLKVYNAVYIVEGMTHVAAFPFILERKRNAATTPHVETLVYFVQTNNLVVFALSIKNHYICIQRNLKVAVCAHSSFMQKVSMPLH